MQVLKDGNKLSTKDLIPRGECIASVVVCA